MPKIGNSVDYADQKCDRCGSKRRVARTWTEKIKNDHGTMVLHNSQIICTNKECQKKFDLEAKKEIERRQKKKPANTNPGATKKPEEAKKSTKST